MSYRKSEKANNPLYRMTLRHVNERQNQYDVTTNNQYD